MILHNKIDAQLPSWRNRVVKLLKENGDKVASIAKRFMFYANKVTLQFGNCQRKSKLIGI